MAVKLSDVLKDQEQTDGVAPAVREYEEGFNDAKESDLATKRNESRRIAELYYDLVTDFYEFGWGRSFHFAPRVPGESFKASLARHEHFLAHMLGLRPGMVVADIGCGVGGPLVEIARFSGARIVGINTNAYQIERARTLTKEAGLDHLAEFLHCDFQDIDAPDNTFDAVYDIEATCHAPDKVSVYAEVFRVLKPGACFGAYEYCMTDRFDPGNAEHRKIKADIQLGGGLLDIDDYQTVDAALQTVGFEVLETRDLLNQPGPGIPWYEPLVGSGISFASFRSSKVGRSVTTNTLRALETLRIVPQGSVNVSQKLNLCAAAMAEAGRLGIFTPMYFLHARKPG
jgi:sterol 24-C-methyltransferase